MEDIMLVEGLGSVTLVNGLLRVQLLATDPTGNAKETGSLEIPANRVVEVVNGLAKGVQDMSAKLNEASEATTQAEKSADKRKSLTVQIKAKRKNNK